MSQSNYALIARLRSTGSFLNANLKIF